MKYFLPNFTVQEFLNLQDAEIIENILFCAKYGKQFKISEDRLDIGYVPCFTFHCIKEYQKRSAKGIDIIQFINFLYEFELKKTPISNYSFLSLVQTFNYMNKEVNDISELEIKLLSSQVTDTMEAAGINEFAMFGYEIQLNELSKLFNCSWDAVRKMKYEDCFTRLLIEKKEREFIENYRILTNSQSNE